VRAVGGSSIRSGRLEMTRAIRRVSSGLSPPRVIVSAWIADKRGQLFRKSEVEHWLGRPIEDPQMGRVSKAGDKPD
jgi:hypothetical protein